MASTPATLAGFTVLPVAYPGSATHFLYARAHLGSKSAARSNDFPAGRTLFLVNVPPDATEREVTLFFKHGGTIERVAFDDDAGEDELLLDEADSDDEDEDAEELAMDIEETVPRKHKRKQGTADDDPAPKVIPIPSVSLRTLRRTGRTAHIVFLDASSLARALHAPSAPRPWPTSPAPSGLAHYTALYDARRPPLDAVRDHADAYAARFDWAHARARAAARYRKGEAVVDADGFTLVTRGSGAYGKTAGGGVGVASRRFQERAAAKGVGAGEEGTVEGKRGRGRKKKEPRAKDAFYSFQVREKKWQEMQELKQNWEADKAKIEKLKASRRFKPY